MRQLYTKWMNVIEKLLPDEPETRRTNFVQMLVGIYASRSVHLSEIAKRMVSSAKRESLVVRLSRFLDNAGVEVEGWYEPLARGMVESLVRSGAMIRLIIDGSKITGRHQLLMVSVAYRRRAIPLVWSWLEYKKGHSDTKKQLKLLERARRLLTGHKEISLVGDSEFGNPLLLSELESWGWLYALKQNPKDYFQARGGEWRKLKGAVLEGQSIDYGLVKLTKKHAFPTRLIAHWEAGHKDPWLLATNYLDKQSTLRAYQLRMWVEELFADCKGSGFDIEKTRLRSTAKLDRLMLVVAVLYLWLVAFGSKIIKQGLRHLVDRKSRRDLSIFRIGYDSVIRRVTNDQSLTVFLTPYP